MSQVPQWLARCPITAICSSEQRSQLMSAPCVDLGGETFGRQAPTRSETHSGNEEPATATILKFAHSSLHDLPDATLAAPPHSGRGHLHARELREDGGADMATQTAIGLIGGQPRLFNIAWEDAPQYISLRETVFFTRKKRKPTEHGPTDH